MEPKINLYLGDCVSIMSSLEDESVDLTVTSPPYADLRNYDGFSWCFDDTAKQLYRLTKVGGVVVWVVGDKTKNGSESLESFRQAMFFRDLGFNVHDTMIYYRWSGPLTHRRYEQEFEYMFVFSKGTPKTFNPIMVDCVTGGVPWKRKNGGAIGTEFDKNRKFRKRENSIVIKDKRIDGNVWHMLTASHRGERNGHPAPFPEELAYRHIVSWSNPKDVVLDPFMGSGTTGKVSVMNNRDFIGIEISSKYFSVASDRIKDSCPV